MNSDEIKAKLAEIKSRYSTWPRTGSPERFQEEIAVLRQATVNQIDGEVSSVPEMIAEREDILRKQRDVSR